MKLCLNVINHYSLKKNLLVNLYLSTEVLLIVINQSAVPIETAMNAALKDESLVRQSSDILSNTYLTKYSPAKVAQHNSRQIHYEKQRA